MRHGKHHLLDVPGDRWVGWFGPRTHDAYIQLNANPSPSPFWDADERLREQVPPLPVDADEAMA